VSTKRGAVQYGTPAIVERFLGGREESDEEEIPDSGDEILDADAVDDVVWELGD